MFPKVAPPLSENLKLSTPAISKRAAELIKIETKTETMKIFHQSDILKVEDITKKNPNKCNHTKVPVILSYFDQKEREKSTPKTELTIKTIKNKIRAKKIELSFGRYSLWFKIKKSQLKNIIWQNPIKYKLFGPTKGK